MESGSSSGCWKRSYIEAWSKHAGGRVANVPASLGLFIVFAGRLESSDSTKATLRKKVQYNQTQGQDPLTTNNIKATLVDETLFSTRRARALAPSATMSYSTRNTASFRMAGEPEEGFSELHPN